MFLNKPLQLNEMNDKMKNDKNNFDDIAAEEKRRFVLLKKLLIDLEQTLSTFSEIERLNSIIKMGTIGEMAVKGFLVILEVDFKDNVSFNELITKLKYKLARQGFESYRVVAVNESNTSKRCSRCFSTNTTRTGQGQFNCHKCNYELNADLNGAKNIGKRLIKYSLEPNKKYKDNLRDILSGDFHSLDYYKYFQPLSQWLKYTTRDTSFL